MSIKGKLIGLFLSALIPLLAVLMFGLYNVKKVRDVSITEIEYQVGNFTAESVQTFLDRRSDTFTVNIVGENVKSVPDEQQQFLLTQLFTEDPHLLRLGVINARGIEEHVLERDQPTTRKTLRDVKNESFYKATSQRNYYFGPATFINGTPTLELAAPMVNVEKEIIGAIVAVIDLSPIREAVERVEIGNSGYAYLVDAAGNIIARPSSLIDRDAPPVLTSRRYVSYSPRSSENPIYIGLTGEDVKTAVLPVPIVGWFVVVEWPVSDAYDIIYAIALQIALITGAVLLLLLLLWKLIRPFDNIIRAVGAFDHEEGAATGSELDVTGKIQKMIASIRRQEKEQYEFITSASHQLRTPASGMRLELELLRDMLTNNGKKKDDHSELLELVDEIRSNNDRTVLLVDDLLKIIELGRDYAPSEVGPIKLEKLVASILNAYKDDGDARSIEFTVSIPSRLTLVADETGIKTVLRNLFDNAVTYSDDGGKIEISAKKQKDSVTVSVRDTGIGIPRKEQLNVFDTFFRAKNAYAKKSSGTGLGLVIVKRIIEGHGGEVDFSSEEGKGSTFTFTMPAPKK
jgi:signal transduction histidine kinase